MRALILFCLLVPTMARSNPARAQEQRTIYVSLDTSALRTELGPSSGQIAGTSGSDSTSAGSLRTTCGPPHPMATTAHSIHFITRE